jgi:hypothetical protein
VVASGTAGTSLELLWAACSGDPGQHSVESGLEGEQVVLAMNDEVCLGKIEVSVTCVTNLLISKLFNVTV